MPTSTRRSSIRRSGIALAAAAGLLAAAACSPPPTTGISGSGREGIGGGEMPECPVGAHEEVEGKVKVTLWYGGLVMPTSGVLIDMAKKFNASQDKIEVTLADQGVDYDETLRAFDKTVSTPAQLPQVIYLEDTQLGKMVDSNTVMPAQACMEADGYDMRQILPAVRASFSVDGVLYPGYMNTSTPVLYYNKAHWEKAGLDPDSPPKTLDEVLEVSKVIRDAGISNKPFSFKADQWFFNTWLSGLGVDAVNNANGRIAPATESNLLSDESVALMEKLAEMKSEGIMNVFPVTAGNIDHYLALVTEESSMVIETSTASSTIASVFGGDIDTDAAGDAGIDVSQFDLSQIGVIPGSGPLPGVNAAGQVYASGGVFYILNAGGTGGEMTDAQISASWEFLKFMLQPENAKDWHITGGYLPIVKSVAEDPDVAQFQTNTLQGILVRPSVTQLEAADPDRVSPLVGPYSAYSDALQGAMETVLLPTGGPGDVQAALKKADAEMKAALDNYNDSAGADVEVEEGD